MVESHSPCSHCRGPGGSFAQITGMCACQGTPVPFRGNLKWVNLAFAPPLPEVERAITFWKPMTDFNAFVSPEYPVIHATGNLEHPAAVLPEGHTALSLALLVQGIPSFLATIPVQEDDLEPIVDSLNRGNVRVAVVGISVDGSDLPGAPNSPEPWKAETEEARSLPAAFLSLVCTDGRRIGVARIVARENSATPEDIARFVLKQIAQGVQIPDLASTP